jgi:hypothetical protein
MQSFMLISCLAYSSNLMTEVICSSETLVDFHRAAWHHILVDRLLELQMQRDDNKSSEIIKFLRYSTK